jgi:F-box protein 9
VVGDDDGDDYVPTQSFDGASKQLSRTIADDGGPSEQKQLVSALDHYEEAMEKEAQGNMGDSLHLYRRAYRVSYDLCLTSELPR